ncbi:senescence-associated carboxylesterase 101 [Rutidosis leptorrhynchoides]|uniref:senescence-associated carboxylesterase 101 n=1 Tax=Rutidosis leptorrhynchoides TaxID=125765 RepID=UPI003A9A5F73
MFYLHSILFNNNNNKITFKFLKTLAITHQNMFCSGVELSKFLRSIDIIPDAYLASSKTSGDYQLHTSTGIQILAFNSPNADYTARFLKPDSVFVSSDNHTSVDFILTKVNKKFSINKAALDLFDNHNPKDIKTKVKLDIPLIITGRGLGGYIATLFTLWLQNAIDVKESDNPKIKFKRPICITFGTPLVGDKFLQLAISERPQWKSSFLNVVAKKDYIASLFTSKNSDYKPFGTFMFCNESGGHSAFEDQEAVLAVLDVMVLPKDEQIEMFDYANVMILIKRKVLYRGAYDQLGELNMNPLKAGITLQLKEVVALKDISNDVIEKVEKRQKSKIINKKKFYEPTKKLNDMKISLTCMEWYMTRSETKGGYYDRYKNFKNATTIEEIKKHEEITKHVRMLYQYWSNTVKEKNLMPQKEGSKLRTRWLLGGTNYRRIVEPLIIADYYHKDKKTNYVENRDEHFKLLEIWLNEEKMDSGPRTKAASLTEDSCFWAHVEEALILLKNLKNGGSSNISADIEQLEKFEADLMHAINGYYVSPTIFFDGSSLMKWWNEYKEFKGGSYDTEFAQYMNNGNYKLYK